jgi:hypothetical protein
MAESFETAHGSLKVSLDDFDSFGANIATYKRWGELPDWFAVYWVNGRSLEDDHKAFQADLDRNTPEARAFLIQLLKWKLTK